MAGLALLRVAPELDVHWEHHRGHFWLVVLVGAINFGLGFLMGEAASRREDARVFLVSLVFLSSAGFLILHALATPGEVLKESNPGYVIAAPIGLLIAAGFAAASSLDLQGERAEALVRSQRKIRAALLAVMAGWAAVSLLRLPPLDGPLSHEEAEGPLVGLAVVGSALFGFAAVRYTGLYRRRGGAVVLAVIAAFVLLSEAMIGMALARSWHMSGWEWHLLMLAAFGILAVSVEREYRRRESVESTFASLYLEQTLGRVNESYAAALKELVAEPGERPNASELRQRFHLSADDVDWLDRAAEEVRRIDELYRPYLSPQLATRLRTEPRLAELGGEHRAVSVFFADLEGFTSFSERSAPAEVIAMLNEYWGSTVPVVLNEYEGIIERFAGDSVLVIFNAAVDQPDHPVRAARAALEMQRASEQVAAKRPDWPQFRIGVNTGPAIVGNVGTSAQRSFAAIGDTTNLAFRLQTLAEAGSVVIGEATRDALGPLAQVEELGELQIKGKERPVRAYVLRALAGVQNGGDQPKHDPEREADHPRAAR